MAGLVPAIHVFPPQDVDARDKPAHDSVNTPASTNPRSPQSLEGFFIEAAMLVNLTSAAARHGPAAEETDA
jgi:hypothetical protein